ncbi:MAG: hypothetical protein JEZ11_00280 [Desulfobacterales bacterium]|nr:hypothetical protein [Desulfobacterales bacterium]
MLLFREESRPPDGQGPAARSAEVPAEADMDPERIWVCRQCGHAITHPDQGIIVDGAHRHTFANPHGMVYEIGCFRSADGCANVGPTTDEFTWFAGFFWRIAVCRRCQVHLGWLFESRGMRRFHGLILDRLAISADGGGSGSAKTQ